MFVFLLRPEEYTIHEQSDSDLDDQPGGELEEPDENDHGSTRIDRFDAAATLDGEDAALHSNSPLMRVVTIYDVSARVPLLFR
jgi:hypothetical protein